MIRARPVSIALNNARPLKLWDAWYGEDGDCEPDGPCWLLDALSAPFALVALIVNANDSRDEVKVHGKDQVISQCNLYEGYFTRKTTFPIKSLPIAEPAPNLPVCVDRRNLN
jgi:hypothetical protein